MGYNSGLIIMNDSLHVIQQNPVEFTEKVVSTIQSCGGHLKEGDSINIGLGHHANAAELFHMTHADIHSVYLVGGNSARFIPGGSIIHSQWRDPKAVDLELLRSMADAAGYTLRKKSTRKN